MGTGGRILKLWFEDMFASGKKFTLLGNLDDLCYNTSLQTFFIYINYTVVKCSNGGKGWREGGGKGVGMSCQLDCWRKHTV